MFPSFLYRLVPVISIPSASVSFNKNRSTYFALSCFPVFPLLHYALLNYTIFLHSLIDNLPCVRKRKQEVQSMNQTQISVNHRQIGYRIKEVRDQNHISQAQLAEMTDLSVSYISHIENAKRKASLESVIRIVNALGITVDELLAGVQMNNPAAYQTDIDMLMENCSENEKRFIYELIKASLETMHKNGWELASSDRHR